MYRRLSGCFPHYSGSCPRPFLSFCCHFSCLLVVLLAFFLDGGHYWEKLRSAPHRPLPVTLYLPHTTLPPICYTTSAPHYPRPVTLCKCSANFSKRKKKSAKENANQIVFASTILSEYSEEDTTRLHNEESARCSFLGFLEGNHVTSVPVTSWFIRKISFHHPLSHPLFDNAPTSPPHPSLKTSF